MNNDVENGNDFPPISPAGETAAPSNPAFVNQCLSQLNSLSGMGKITPGPNLLTKNNRWGSVFRADFSIGNEKTGPLRNRLVCWKQKDGQISIMLAIGQAVPALNRAN